METLAPQFPATIPKTPSSLWCCPLEGSLPARGHVHPLGSCATGLPQSANFCGPFLLRRAHLVPCKLHLYCRVSPSPQPQASAPFPGVLARRVFHSLPGALAERREVLHPAFALTASGTGRACFGGWAELMKLGDKGLSGEGCRIVPFPFKPFLGLCATCQTPYTLTLVPPSRHEPLGVVCACAPWELHVCGSGGWFWGGEGCRL